MMMDPLLRVEDSHLTSSAMSPPSGQQQHRQQQQQQQHPEKHLPCVCSVCGDGASEHLHYGAICCFSCRAFFRRYADRQGVLCVRGDNSCVVDVAKRNDCMNCRLKKCREAGMKKDYVRGPNESLRKKRAEQGFRGRKRTYNDEKKVNSVAAQGNFRKKTMPIRPQQQPIRPQQPPIPMPAMRHDSFPIMLPRPPRPPMPPRVDAAGMSSNSRLFPSISDEAYNHSSAVVPRRGHEMVSVEGRRDVDLFRKEPMRVTLADHQTLFGSPQFPPPPHPTQLFGGPPPATTLIRSNMQMRPYHASNLSHFEDFMDESLMALHNDRQRTLSPPMAESQMIPTGNQKFGQQFSHEGRYNNIIHEGEDGNNSSSPPPNVFGDEASKLTQILCHSMEEEGGGGGSASRSDTSSASYPTSNRFSYSDVDPGRMTPSFHYRHTQRSPPSAESIICEPELPISLASSSPPAQSPYGGAASSVAQSVQPPMRSPSTPGAACEHAFNLGLLAMAQPRSFGSRRSRSGGLSDSSSGSSAGSSSEDESTTKRRRNEFDFMTAEDADAFDARPSSATSSASGHVLVSSRCDQSPVLTFTNEEFKFIDYIRRSRNSIIGKINNAYYNEEYREELTSILLSRGKIKPSYRFMERLNKSIMTTSMELLGEILTLFGMSKNAKQVLMSENAAYANLLGSAVYTYGNDAPTFVEQARLSGMANKYVDYLESAGLAQVVPRMEAHYLNPAPFAEKEGCEDEVNGILKDIGKQVGTDQFLTVILLVAHLFSLPDEASHLLDEEERQAVGRTRRQVALLLNRYLRAKCGPKKASSKTHHHFFLMGTLKRVGKVFLAKKMRMMQQATRFSDAQSPALSDPRRNSAAVASGDTCIDLSQPQRREEASSTAATASDPRPANYPRF